MKAADIPDNEYERLKALRETGLLDSLPEERFDRLARIVKNALKVPIALVSLVDEHRQWFKSKQGLSASETPRDFAFCAYSILQDHIFEVSNTLEDERFADNPLVVNDPNIRFYAGCAIRSTNGYRIGTLCVIDTHPRELTDEEKDLLKDIADSVQNEIWLTEKLRITFKNEQRLEFILAGTNVGTWEWNIQTGQTVFNERWANIAGYTLDELEPVSIETWKSLAHPEDLEKSSELLQKHFNGETEFYDVKARMRHKNGHWVWVRARGRLTSRTPDGEPLVIYGTHEDITAQIEAQQALKDSELQFRSLVNNLPGVTYRCRYDKHWTMLYMSDKVDPLSGYPASDFIQNRVRSYDSVIHPDDKPELEQAVSAAVKNSQEWFLEYRVLHRDGNIRWAQEKGRGIKNESGKVEYFDGFILDITQEKRNQQQLKKQLSAFKALNRIASLAPDDPLKRITHALNLACSYLKLEIGIVSRIYDEQYEIVACYGPEAAGLEPGQKYSLNDTYCEIVLSQSKTVAIHNMAMSEYNQHPCYEAFALESYIGLPLEVNSELFGTLNFSSAEAREEPFKETEKQFLRLLARWVSSTLEFKQKNEIIENSESRLRGLFELSPIGIALNDYETGKFIDLNNALLAPTGYTRKEFVELSYWDVTPREYEEEEAKQLEDLTNTGRYGPYEKEYIRKDGSRYPVLLNGMIVHDDNGKKLIWSMIEDISERKRNDEIKNEFVSTVSHELRTPITAITGALDLLLAGAVGDIPESAHEMMEVAKKNSVRMNLLINDILDLEKLLAGKMDIDFETLSVTLLLSEIVQRNRPYAQRFSVTLDLDIIDPSLFIYADSQRFEQVITNLISNAVKFSPKNESVLITAAESGSNIRIAVKDKGAGIPKDFQPRLFEKFAQANASNTRATGGTGLGLSICKEILERLSGSIDFITGPNGTEFFVLLPKASADGGVDDEQN